MSTGGVLRLVFKRVLSFHRQKGVKLGLDRMLRNRLGEEKGLQHFLSGRGKNEGRKEISLSRFSTKSV